jgi:hypothetical protein
MSKINSIYLNNILSNLGNISYEEFITQYKYAGGDKNSHANYFDMAYPNHERPKHETICLCAVKIKENCYITKDDKTFHVIGNCCIKRFLDKDKTKRTCEVCSKPHKNRKDNRCNYCRLIKIHKGLCVDCNKKIDIKYKRCYKCFKSKNQNLHHDHQENELNIK